MMRRHGWAFFLLAWGVLSFALASYHPPQTLADRVLVRAGRYEAWRFDSRRDTRRLVIILVPGLVVGGLLALGSRR